MGSGASKQNAAADDTPRRLPGSAVPPKPPVRATPKQTSFSAKGERSNGHHAVNGSTKGPTKDTAGVQNGIPSGINGGNGHIVRPKSRLQSSTRMKR